MTSSTPAYIASLLANHPELANYNWASSFVNTPDAGSASANDQKALAGYVDSADATLDPYYKRETNYQKNKDTQDEDASVAAYQNTVNSLNESLKSDVDTLNDKEGQNGTWGSSARAERLGSLANKYNTSYTSAFNTAKNSLANTQLGSEYQLGTDNMVNASPLSSFMAKPVGSSISTTANDSYKYNPFKTQGVIPSSRVGSSASLGANNFASNYYAPLKGFK